jgi:hypothetical protein
MAEDNTNGTAGASADNASAAPDAAPTVALTNKDVAKLVYRDVPTFKDDGTPTGKTKKTPLEEKEVFDFHVRDDGTLVVVTIDGKKLFGTVN